MSVESEIAALTRMLQISPSDILAVAAGTVQGGTLSDRDGILFATNVVAGVFAEGSIFTSDDVCFFGYDSVKFITKTAAQLSVHSGTGKSRLQVSLQLTEWNTADAENVSVVIRAFASLCFREDVADVGKKLLAASENRNIAEVERCAKHILERQPDCYEALWQLGWVSREQEQYAQAIECYRKMLDVYPVERALPLAAMATTFLFADDFEQAETCATQSLEAASRADAYVTRAQARARRGDRAASMNDAKRAVEIEPDHTVGWRLLAAHAEELSDTTELKRAIEALTRLGDNELVATLQPRLHLLRDDPQAALDAARESLKSFPNLVPLAVLTLEAAMEISDEEALSWVRWFDKLHAEDPEYQLWACFALIQSQQARESLERFQRTTDFTSTEFGRSLRAVLEAASRLEFGDAEESLKISQAATETFPAPGAPGYDSELFIVLRYLLGSAMLRLDRFEEAQQHLQFVESEVRSHASFLRWIRKDLPALLDQATRGAARRSYDGIAPSPTNRAGTFEALRILAEALEASGRHRDLALRVRDDLVRFDEPPLVAVMGEYSVGKSSFINALVRRPGLLPTGDGVTTGTITVLRYGEQERMRAVFKSGRVIESDSLQPVDRFVREADGEERKGLHHVDVFVRSEVLRRVSVVDSPGLNAPFPEHKAITEAFLEEADAICFLFNVENTGKSEEAAFLDKLRRHSRKAVGVVNQIDLVSTSDAREVIDAVSIDFPGVFTTVLGVSARRALDGIERSDDVIYGRSGMPTLESWLETNLLATARQIKAGAVRARARGVVHEVQEAHATFNREIDALLKGLQDRRAALLRWTSDDLRALLHEELAKVRDNLATEISRVAEATAANAEASNAPRGTFFDQWGRKLIEATKAARGLLLEALHAQHDAQLLKVRSYFDEIRGSQWHEPMREGIGAFILECASWRKDLEDYVEQPVSFLEGFVEARGLATIVYTEVPDGSYNRVDLVRAALTPRLAFLHERIGLAATRWASELRVNYDDAFTRLDRILRAEAARVREHSFRRIEALDMLFVDV